MFDHVQLACPAGSEHASRAFYVDVLGFVEVPKPPALAARGGCWFRGPGLELHGIELHGIELHLGVEQDFRPARKAHPGIRVADLDGLAKRLRATGRSITVDDTEVPGRRRFHTEDPHGNRLEFLADAEPEWPLADDVRVRRARADDIPALVGLLADDALGRDRESTGDEAALEPYRTAFAAIRADPHQLLVVLERAGEVVGTCQLTFTPGLSRRGALRMTIEAVRLRADVRGTGLGTAMIDWALDRARERGVDLAQLTTDRARADALRFYRRLGFRDTHHGLKLSL